jgi:hypothetical protein
MPDSIPAVTITNNVYSEVRLHRTRQHLRAHVSAGSNWILRSAQVLRGNLLCHAGRAGRERCAVVGPSAVAFRPATLNPAAARLAARADCPALCIPR